MTYLDKLAEIKPEFIERCTENELASCTIGCPYLHNLGNEGCPDRSELNPLYNSLCVACWHREYPEEKKAEPELKYENNIEEEKKMKNLRNLIVSKVDEAVDSGRIDEYVESYVDGMDLDSEIDDLIETEVENTIEDYVGPILSEAVRDAVRGALENLFN